MSGAQNFQSWQKMTPPVVREVDGETTGEVATTEATTSEEVAEAMGEVGTVVAATVVVEEIGAEDEDTEAVGVVEVEEDIRASVETAGVMMEAWVEAGEVVETVEVWTTTREVLSFTIRNPSIKACVVASARLTQPLLLLHILRNPSHTESNLKNSTLLSIKHARATTIVPSTLRT